MPRLKALALALLPSLLIGAVAGIYPGYRVYDYVWKNADFCLSCHVHDYASVGWAKSIHGQSTTCHDCHHQPLRAYIKEAYVMVKERPKFPKDLHHTPYVPKNLCASCHLSGAVDRSTITGPMQSKDVEKIPKVDRSALHSLHLSKTTKLVLQNHLELTEGERAENPIPLKNLSQEKGEERSITCADCHGGPANRGHNFSASDVSCIRCHEPKHTGKMVKEFGCRSCHFQDFIAPVGHGR